MIRHQIIIYCDEIYVKSGQKIDDTELIARVIYKQISHLGKFTIQVKPKPKTFFQIIIRSLAGTYLKFFNWS